MYRALFLLLFCSGALAAQDLKDLGRRLDSVNRAAGAAHAALVAYEREHPRQQGNGGPASTYDTLTIAAGHATVLVNTVVASIGRASAARADTNLRRLGTALDLFPSAVFTISPGDGTAAQKGVRVGYRQGGGGGFANEPGDPVADAHWVAGRVVPIGIDRSKTPFSIWQRGRLPLDVKDLAVEPDWRLVRLNLLSSPSFLGHRCYQGQLEDCARFVGLREDPDPVRHFYDSLARVSAVREHREAASREQASATAHCLTGSDSSCALALWAVN